MPRGGARVGSGRKPKYPRAVATTDVEPQIGSADVAVPLIPPTDLSVAQRDFWQRYAARAIEKRTLTIHTVEAFRELCEVAAEKQKVLQTIEEDGRTFIKVTVDGSGQEHQELKAHPLKGDYARLAKLVQNMMEKFMLAPFGKPAGASPRSTADLKKATRRAQFFGGASA